MERLISKGLVSAQAIPVDPSLSEINIFRGVTACFKEFLSGTQRNLEFDEYLLRGLNMLHTFDGTENKVRGIEELPEVIVKIQKAEVIPQNLYLTELGKLMINPFVER